MSTRWISVGPIHEGDRCEVKALAPKAYVLELRMGGEGAGASLTTTAEVAGKRVCDPCLDPWQ